MKYYDTLGFLGGNECRATKIYDDKSALLQNQFFCLIQYNFQASGKISKGSLFSSSFWTKICYFHTNPAISAHSNANPTMLT
jgi:hypothetical protein